MKKAAVIRGIFLWLIFLCLSGIAQGEEAGLSFSHASGFYKRGFELEITCPVPGAQIYYTLDGCAPDEFCDLYEEPLSLSMTVGVADPLSQRIGVNIEENFIPMQDFPTGHVIRARALLPDGEWTAEKGGTYFIGYDREELYGDLPVISIMADERDLFDYEYGIYVLGQVFEDWDAQQTEYYEPWEITANFTSRGRDWEREVMVDFMMGEGNDFSQVMGLRIKGGANRGGTQKSLRLIAREEYGKKNMIYPFFPDNRDGEGKLIEKYKSITLRAGGNDRDFGRIRDPLITNLSAGLSLETAKNRPAIAFINGEFWGVYTLNEEYSDHHIQNHYGIDNDYVITWKVYRVDDGQEGDERYYWAMHRFITQNDMADPALYARACEMLDMQSFADLVALHLYIYNQDGLFEYNNWQMWRVREPGRGNSPYADGKWRMMLYDSDYSSGVYDNGQNYRVNNIKDSLEKKYDEGHPALMVQSLLKNEEFKKMLILSFSDIRSLYFTNRRVSDMLSHMREEYSPYIPMTYRRFGPQWVAQWDPERHMNSNMNAISAFFSGRANNFASLMRSAFHLKNAVTITVKTKGEGHVLINGREIPISGSQKIFYFPEYPISVTAVPGEGMAFTGWEINQKNGQLADAAAAHTSLSFTDSVTLTACFQRAK